MDTAQHVVPRGGTFHGTTGTIDTSNYGPTVGMEGTPIVFRSGDPDDKTKFNYTQGIGDVDAILVRNVSGITQYPGMGMIWASGYRGKRVSARNSTAAEEIAGIVDDHLNDSNGVRNGDLFWLIVKGPVLLKKNPTAGDEETVWAAGDVLYGLAAASSQATSAGRFQPWNSAFTASSTDTTDGDLGKILMNKIGRVISAVASSGNTNVDRLVDLNIVT